MTRKRFVKLVRARLIEFSLRNNVKPNSEINRVLQKARINPPHSYKAAYELIEKMFKIYDKGETK